MASLPNFPAPAIPLPTDGDLGVCCVFVSRPAIRVTERHLRLDAGADLGRELPGTGARSCAGLIAEMERGLSDVLRRCGADGIPTRGMVSGRSRASRAATAQLPEASGPGSGSRGSGHGAGIKSV